MSEPADGPAAIYIHVPFCVQKCSYCDFYSCTQLSRIPDYLSALKKEIHRQPGSDQSIETLYLGGGTPSVLSAQQVEQVLGAVHDRYQISNNAEITLEVNPGTVSQEKFRAYYRLGINRLSIGVQSFNDEKLKFLNRIHTAEQARGAIEMARSTGFKNIGIDLMYGLPLESPETWQADLESAVELNLSHLSCYMLTIEPSTPLYENVQKKKIKGLDPKLQSMMFRQTALSLSKNGYTHYEISNFAQGKENRSRHNSTYWQMKPYLGFGPAAHSYIRASGRDNRSWNHADLGAYTADLALGRFPVEDRESLTKRQQMAEYILLGLRTKDGINILKFNARFKENFESVFKLQIKKVCENELGLIKDSRFALNLNGWCRLDNIVEAFTDPLL